MDILQLFEDLMGRVTEDEFELFLVQCWIIWNQRNSVLHGGTVQDPSRLNKHVEDFLKEYRDAQEQLAIQPTTSSMQQRASWIPPSGLAYKLNFDAAVFAGINASGVGTIIRNAMGEVMVALSARGLSVMDSEEAEVLACRRAMEFAMEIGFRELVLEGENVTVRKALLSPRATCSRLGHIYWDIQCMAMGFRDFFVSCVKRSADSVAHSLARQTEEEAGVVGRVSPTCSRGFVLRQWLIYE
ncbi:uncharacterized protein LOC111985933 [Quercus suber]|uniref:uncharacterized protein LOC111985933 n=1 Tax=Quercus suber TaxID=58331 RepID=UPI0032DF202D